MSQYNLHIKNFQSIQEATLKLQGFVAITGKSNLGKSAVRRAITSVLYNDWDKAFLREGTNLPTEVTISKDDLFTVHMKKSSEHNDFSITTAQGVKSFNKVGKSIPEEITNLGYNLLQLDDESFNLTSSKQTDPLFVVSFKQATTTKLLNKLFNISKLEAASRLVQTDIRRHKIDHNAKVEQHNKMQAQLNELTSQLETTSSNLSSISELISNLEVIIAYCDTSSKLSVLETSIKDKDIYLSSLSNKLHLLHKISYITQGISKLTANKSQQEQTSQAQEVNLSSLSQYQYQLSSLVQMKEFLSSIHKIDKLSSITSQLQEITTRLNTINQFSNLIDNFNLNKQLVLYLKYTKHLSNADIIINNKQSQINAEVEKLSTLRDLSTLTLYGSIRANHSNLESRISDVTLKLTSLNEDLKNFLCKKQELHLITCPNCNHKFSLKESNEL